ncbi:MAG: hypothetical protein HYS41_06900 [Candidatus Omnitrophica bacterium]|nr:hypothetical protein [Candidatus Omnitrophota bacterium]
MPDESWPNWLNRWLKAHPVKEPPAHLGADYSKEVMRRIRSAPRPVPGLGWLTFPRPSFALGAALACLLAALLIWRGPELAQLNLERELQESDRIVLAEAVTAEPADEQPDETDELAEEEVPDEEVLEELQALDELELIG